MNFPNQLSKVYIVSILHLLSFARLLWLKAKYYWLSRQKKRLQNPLNPTWNLINPMKFLT